MKLQQHLNQYINICLHRECCKTSFICCFIVTNKNLIWSVVFLFFCSWWDVIILDKYTKNHGHMLYCFWDMARDGCNCYFSFWAIFCPFAPLTAQKNQKNFKKNKTHGDIVSHVYQKLWSDDARFLRYGVQQMVRQTNRQTERVTYRSGYCT